MTYLVLIFWSNRRLSHIEKIACFEAGEATMTEDNNSEGKVTGGSGIVTGGNATFGNISGQFAVGANINMVQSISQPDLKELRESLLEFQKGINKLGLDPDHQNVINGDISTAVIEVKKEKPQVSEIKQCFEKAIQMVKGAGKTISSVSELYEPAIKIAKLLGIAASFVP
jgi:hypothetical protein